MIDPTLTRLRCRATREIRTSQGLIRCSTQGVTQCEIDNLGRHLILVRWDSGVTDYAYPSEIEILGQEAVPSQPATIESVPTEREA
jgi:hypothetical protein